MLRSGSVATRKKTAAEQSDTAFTFDKNSSFTGEQIIPEPAGNDLLRYEIPDPTLPVPTTGTPVPNPADYDKYYRVPFNNNIRPQLTEIDTISVPAKVVFELHQEVDEIRAVDDDGLEMSHWDTNNFDVDLAAGTMTINPNSIMNQGAVRFLYLDESHHATGLTQPAIEITNNQLLSEDDIYNYFAQVVPNSGGQGGGGGGQAPVITTIPSSIELGTDATIASDSKCDWTITGGGTLIGTTTDVQTVQYESVDSTLNINNKISDVSGRFGNTPDNNVTVTCANSGGTVTEDFIVTYAPWSTSSLTGYEYSWYAAGSTSWFDAAAECQTLTEEGVPPGTWKLPSQALYDDLDGIPNDSKTDPAEGVHWCGTWTGSDCSDMPDGVATIWLEEEQNASNAYNIVGNSLQNIGAASKTDASSYRGFRCVK